MGKAKAKNGTDQNLNIDSAAVKNLFVQLATPEGVILTSTTPQMKNLGPEDGYRYTMWGLDAAGNRCLIVLSADRDGISPKENWASKYPAMKTVSGNIVAEENRKFAAKKIVALCAEEEGLVVIGKEAHAVAIPFGVAKHYGYAMRAAQGQQYGYAVLETGANMVNFSREVPKFI